jgi:hypothetical protein
MIFGANQELEPPINWVREILRLSRRSSGSIECNVEHRLWKRCRAIVYLLFLLCFFSIRFRLGCCARQSPFQKGLTDSGRWFVTSPAPNLGMYWIGQDVSFRGVKVVCRLCSCCDYEFVLNKRFELCGR